MSEERKLSLGEYLKAEREKRGLTIEQTASATKIGLKVLKQLEADQYADLPALPFVRGFVKNYGKFLGLDGEKLLQEYSVFLDEHSRERPKRDAGHSGYAFERPEGEQSRKVLWGVMAGMLVFGGAVVFLFKPSLKRKHHAHVDKFKTNPGSGDDDGSENPNPENPPVPLPSGVPTSIPSGAVPPTPVLSGVPAVVASPVAPEPTHAPSHLPSPAAPFIPPKIPLVLNPNPPEKIPSPSPKAVPPSPTPVAVIAPVEKPTEKPAAAQSIPPTAVPTGTPTEPAASTSLTPEEDLKKDPLQTGTNYVPKEIRVRVVLRTKQDVWVRYRCDGKRLMKFALKKDKILVLRGKESVYFQSSNPDSITYKRGNGPETLLSQSTEKFEYHGNMTVAWPAEAHDKIEEKFKVGPALPFTDAAPAAPLSE